VFHHYPHHHHHHHRYRYDHRTDSKDWNDDEILAGAKLVCYVTMAELGGAASMREEQVSYAN
jgi:hypothetical protein